MMCNLALEISPNDGSIYRNKGEKEKLIYRNRTSEPKKI